ncbi:hypothetical protein [Biformimicrobium ophioploci]|uniref:Oxidase n=1 Tax=Biformimicrobium ophioploci TaxID=3036711 RepID=A0ABQ6M2A1_9GAMM|nr:hypothetical protein [Microbulbifer sp. NKW57]GMG88470.1 hypothetical protein MNKW57_27910 [Microbulbifer sp. NKW57]
MDDRLKQIVLQLRVAAPVVIVATGVSLVMFVAAFFIAEKLGFSYVRFVNDPAAISGRNPFSGVYSNLGVLVWCAAAAVCVFAGWNCLKHGLRKSGRFLLVSGGITALLTLDDLFMLHEYVFPKMLGVPQEVVFFVYLAMFAGYLAFFCREILDTEFTILAVSFCLLGVSATIDNLIHSQTDLINLIEDWFKFAGLLIWAIYFVRTSNALLYPLDPDSAAAFRLADEKAVEGAAFDAH